MLYSKQFPIDDWSNIDVTIANSNKNLEHLQSIDKAQEAKGESLLFRYFSRPVADGLAWYQVTKVTTKTVTVKWCDGISLDDYCDGMLGDGETTMPRHIIEPLVQGRIIMDKVFARKLNENLHIK